MLQASKGMKKVKLPRVIFHGHFVNGMAAAAIVCKVAVFVIANDDGVGLLMAY